MEYREIRRKDRVATKEHALGLLACGEYGVLCTVDDRSLPYGVPLSYVVLDDVIYFHSAHEGHKIDNMRHSPQVCFTVVGLTLPAYVEDFTTYYESAIVFGTAFEVEEQDKKIEALRGLCKKYLPEHMDKADADIAKSLPATAIYGIKIDHITGKIKKP